MIGPESLASYAARLAGDPTSNLASCLQHLGHLNPAGEITEIERTHVCELPARWTIRVSLRTYGLAADGAGSSIKEAKKDSCAKLLQGLIDIVDKRRFGASFAVPVHAAHAIPALGPAARGKSPGSGGGGGLPTGLDPTSSLNTRLQRLGIQDPSTAVHETGRWHLTDRDWRVKVQVTLPDGSCFRASGDGVTVTDAKKHASAVLLDMINRNSRYEGGGTTAPLQPAPAVHSLSPPPPSSPYYAAPPAFAAPAGASASATAGAGAGAGGGGGGGGSGAMRSSYYALPATKEQQPPPYSSGYPPPYPSSYPSTAPPPPYPSTYSSSGLSPRSGGGGGGVDFHYSSSGGPPPPSSSSSSSSSSSVTLSSSRAVGGGGGGGTRTMVEEDEAIAMYSEKTREREKAREAALAGELRAPPPEKVRNVFFSLKTAERQTLVKEADLGGKLLDLCAAFESKSTATEDELLARLNDWEKSAGSALVSAATLREERLLSAKAALWRLFGFDGALPALKQLSPAILNFTAPKEVPTSSAAATTGPRQERGRTLHQHHEEPTTVRHGAVTRAFDEPEPS